MAAPPSGKTYLWPKSTMEVQECYATHYRHRAASGTSAGTKRHLTRVRSRAKHRLPCPIFRVKQWNDRCLLTGSLPHPSLLARIPGLRVITKSYKSLDAKEHK